MKTGRYAIVLAAGAGSRFGGGKLTALWREEALIRWAVRAALNTQTDGVILVLGAAGAEVRHAVADLACLRLGVVEAADWNDGLSASLKTGLRALPDDAAAVAIFLGDMPLVDPGVADRLLDAITAGAPAARPRSPHGPAHPTAFAASAFPALLTLTGDRGARSVIDSLGDAVATIAVDDPGAVFDIDRPKNLTTP